jgi:cyanophycinase-like exopeptidase
MPAVIDAVAQATGIFLTGGNQMGLVSVVGGRDWKTP